MAGKRGRPNKGPQVATGGKKKVKEQIDYTQNQDIAHLLRIDSIKSINVTKSGHPTSCSSIADLFSILFFHESGLKFHAQKPSHFLNDRLVLSKGHAAPILYAALYRAGVLTQAQLMSLRLKDSLIEGHPVPKIPFVDIATGSLGQGLSVACGMAYSSKYFDKIDNTIFCVCGDGQIAQGSVWQAVDFGRNYKLDNLIAIVDVNRLGQSQHTMHNADVKAIQKKFDAFGWEAVVVNGHDLKSIVNLLDKFRNDNGKPKVIVADTLKGKYFTQKIQGQQNWHGKALGDQADTVINHLKSLIKTQKVEFKTYKPQGQQPKKEWGTVSIKPNYTKGSKISTRKAYGNGLLKARQSNPNVVGLDGDTKNSTFAITLKQKFPQSFVECFIAEQNMVGVTQGLACRNKIAFCSTFAAFFIRAADQIRIAGISANSLKCVGSHSGCSIGEDGPSQMALEDLAFFRTLPKGIVLVPSDGVSTQKAVELVANYHDGPSFIRTGRPDVSVIYDNNQTFQFGKLKVVKKSQNDTVVIVACGVLVHEALKAAESLQTSNIHVRVIDIFSIKPVDKEGLIENISAVGGKVIVAEQHYPEGGLYDVVCGSALTHIKQISHLCVRKVPGSAKPEEQLEIHGLDSKSIEKAVHEIIKA